jgi:hypothetical protein
MRGGIIIAATGTIAVLLSTAPLAKPSPDPDFTPVVIPVGHGPTVVTTADVNHDGAADIVVANADDETVTVLLGDGHGHFTVAPGSPVPCGKAPNDIAVADMNGDGALDLVIANTGTPDLTVLLGDGHGRFIPAPHSPFATPSQPHVHGVAVANFMGDGKPAVVTDSWGQDAFLLIPSDGLGNLLPPGRLVHTGKRPYQRLRAADFNGDGKPDVVTTDLDENAVTIQLGDGRGGFTEAPGSPFPAGGAPWAVAIDDLNHDGALDLAVVPYDKSLTDPAELGLTVLVGDGHGRFRTMPGSPFSLRGCSGPDRVVTGDVNGDGRRDVIVSCAQSDAIVLFLGAPTGGFRAVSRHVETGWSGLAAADFNGDGRDDLVVSNQKAGTITVLLARS